MIPLVYTREALDDLERLVLFLFEKDPAAADEAARVIIDAIRVLERHPYIGRRVRGQLRELVISFGRAGYVALYRLTSTGVELLAIRHQREAGSIT